MWYIVLIIVSEREGGRGKEKSEGGTEREGVNGKEKGESGRKGGRKGEGGGEWERGREGRGRRWEREVRREEECSGISRNEVYHANHE